MHSKKALERLSKRRLVASLMFLLAVLKTREPRTYQKAERQLFNVRRRKGRKHRGRNARKVRTGKKRKAPGSNLAKKAMKYAHVHHVSLKTAWQKVR